MSRFLYFLLLAGCWINCQYTKTKHSQCDRIGKLVDNSKIAILSGQSNISWAFENCKQAKLTSQNLEEIEFILTKCIIDYNTEATEVYKKMNSMASEHELDKKDYLIDLKEYSRQYVAVVNTNGEIEVWINCLCDTSDMDWRKTVQVIFDGGKCFFNLKVNLNKKEWYALMVNGDA